MRCRILHESPGRIRVRAMQPGMSMEQADKLEYFLRSVEGVSKAKVNERTCDAMIWYCGTRENVIRALSEYDCRTFEAAVPQSSGRALAREFEDKLFFLIARRLITRFILPAPVSALLTVIRAVPYITKGIRSLKHKKLEVSVLDAVTIAVSVLRADFATAGSVMFLLRLGELLEEWTYRKSVDDLAQRMYLNVEKVWMKCGDTEVLVSVDEVEPGDRIVVRTGNVIPLDGIIVSGEPAVNEASMTGESLPVRKAAGNYVYAGTVIDEGICEIEVKKEFGSGRYDRIVAMIEDSEKLKSAVETRAAHLADALVPYSLGGTALAWLLTGNVDRALAVLMVDFSCALKLSMPIAVLSAMRECSEHQIAVKGGKFLEAVSDARTIIFDKTGTLTRARPSVAEIITFGDYEESEMLRLAACLEEHYPHSIANAVVAEAERRGLAHREMHSEVEYIVAHGIASTVNGQRVLIGSPHFLMEDEHCRIPDGEQRKFEALPEEYSHLYLAIGGELAAVLCIEDPIREDAVGIIKELRRLGFDKVVMMTGDSRRTAETVAVRLGIDECYAELLPEDKARFIREEHDRGRRVIMIGDGINDSPALSEADAGIAIASGAAIAREVADITISADSLHELLTLRRISDGLMCRIRRNYRVIMGFNSLLIALGFFGVIAPAATATLHNLSTVLISLHSMTNLIESEKDRKNHVDNKVS